MRVQNERVIEKFLKREQGTSPKRNYANGYYMRHGASISTDGTTLYSYSTPIARWVGDTVEYTERKYSNTTTRQQSDLAVMLSMHNVKCTGVSREI